MITAWVQATHVWSCISIWDIVLSVSLRESLHPLGKVSLLEVIILWVCLLFSSTSVLPAVRTEEESLWYVPFLREGKGQGQRVAFQNSPEAACNLGLTPAISECLRRAEAY